jgi:hypothetical protein
MHKITHFLCLGAALALSAPGAARAQHAGDLEVGSDQNGAGNLVIEYAFDERPVVWVSDSGFPGLFTAQDPGFEAIEADEPPDRFSLLPATEISLEIVALDDGVSLLITNGTDAPALLDAAGETARIGIVGGTPDFHQHPNYQLLLSGAPDEFKEGRVYFRLANTAGGAPYGASAVHALALSNGHLPGLEAPTKAEAACQKAVGKADRKLLGLYFKRLVRCLDKLTALDAGGSVNAALGACTLADLGADLAAVTAKATETIAAKCGPLGPSSTPFTATAVKTHLGMVTCRAAEVAGAAYAESFERLAALLLDAGQITGEEEIRAALPCLVMAQAAD